MFTPYQLSKKIGVTRETLRKWETEGKIKAIKTQGGHRRYTLPSFGKDNEPVQQTRCIIYARVSSHKQQGDLERQIDFIKKQYPTYEVISDIGSGINFKRKGLLSILDISLQGSLKEVVVAHKDRLCRFGYEIFEHVFRQNGALLTILEDTTTDPTEDLSTDLMSIVTVFTARYYGKRKYKDNEDTKGEDLS